MSPQNPTLFAGEQQTIVIEAEYFPCFNGIPQWFEINPFDLSTSSSNPFVVTYSPNTATAHDEGEATISAQWTEQQIFAIEKPCFTYPDCPPPEFDCHASFPTAFASTTVKAVKMDITFGDTGESLTQGVKTVIAGQKIDLRLKPANATNISWTVPGVRLKDWKVTHTPGSTVSTAEVILVGDLNTNNAVFYWADGTLPGVAKEVSVTAHVAGKMRTKKAVFNLVKPEATSLRATHQGEIKVVSSFIKYGLGDSGDLPGIKFETGGTINIPTDFNGSTQWVQLVRVNREAIDPRGTFRDQRVGNDVTYPYSTDSITFDSPSQVLVSDTQRMTIADRFSMYLMFQPNIAGSIWVPLKKIDWGWNVVVVPTTFSWRIESQSKTGPFITTTAEHQIWDKNILGPVFTPV
ncbi:MAG: hypothetical protein ACRD5H_13745, partial [Nitrososphaerales archaeon]